MAGFDARRLLPPGAYDVTTDPLQKNTPRSQASRDSRAAVLAPPLGAGRGGAWRGGRSPRAAGTEEAEQRRATRAGERGRGAAAGAGRGSGRWGFGCARAGEALLTAPSPAIPGGAEDRGCAVRGVPGLQAGPRPQRLSVTGAFAPAGAAACAPRSGASGPRSPLLPAHSPCPLPTRRARVAGTKLPVHGADSKLFSSRWPAGHRRDCPRPGSLFGSRSLEKGCAEMRGGAGAPLLQKCAAPAPRDSGQRRRARALASQCNLGCVSLEATYGNGSGISPATARELDEQS